MTNSVGTKFWAGLWALFKNFEEAVASRASMVVIPPALIIAMVLQKNTHEESFFGRAL